LTGGRLARGPLSELIRERSLSLGDRAYLEHARAGRAASFRDLDDAVARWVVMMETAGVPAASTVGLVISDPIDFSVAFLGTIASGRWAAPLDPATPTGGAGGMATALARVQADIVVADRCDPGGLDVDWVDFGRVAPASAEEARRPSPPAGGASGGAVLTSSGTTGAAKVIPLHQSQLLHAARNVAAHHHLTSNDRGFNSLPLFHVNAEVVGLLASLVAGSCLVLDDRFHRTRFWALMGERRITWINAVPAIISRLSEPDRDEIIPSHIRFIRSASAPLPVTTLARFEANTGIPVLETYGMTEAASQITANPMPGTRKPGSVGRPVGVELRVVADGVPGTPEPVLEGEVGHVEIRGPSVIAAYGGHGHRDRIDADGWLRTGDLGHLDEAGYLYLDARNDDVINRGGEKVFPGEIEEVFLADPDVAAAVVVAGPDPELGQVPVAYLVLHGVHDDSARDLAIPVAARLRALLTAGLVRGKRPVSLNVVRHLPAGSTGKVQRRALREGAVPVIYQLDCR
jgi:acyl-CoA synthetase (AMP-forming)/AMP-acid ligase II